VPSRSGVRSRPGLNVRRCDIPRCDVVKVRGLTTTMVHRTLFDLCLRLPAVEALVAIDAAVRARLTDKKSLGRYAELAEGRGGARRLRSLAAFAEPAESPMETRLRWLLLLAGLPRPEVQSTFATARAGSWAGLTSTTQHPGSPSSNDGSNHRERLVEDNRRQNLLINAGFRMLRFTGADIKNQPDLVAAQVRDALESTPLTPAEPNPSARQAPLDTTRRNSVTRV